MNSSIHSRITFIQDSEEPCDSNTLVEDIFEACENTLELSTQISSSAQACEDIESLFFKASPRIQQAIIQKYMKLNSKLATGNKGERVFKMEIVAPRHSAVWWKLPKITSSDPNFELFSRNISGVALKEIATVSY
jgi:hypothetical protein